LVCRGVYALDAEVLAGADSAGVGSARIPESDVGARLVERLAHLGALEGAGRRKRFAERGLSLNVPMSERRVLLVGEAAGIDPVLGEGIAQAILCGSIAGPYLARCIEHDRWGFEDWRREFSRTPFGIDLTLRTRSLSLVYGRGRPVIEHWVSRSSDLAHVGMQGFAGTRISRFRAARAAIDLARAALVAR
jgi:flavin-dependent dehydrogenase